MPKYLIEREVAGAGRLSDGELAAMSQKSCSVLNDLGPAIQWVQSYVTDDHIFCTYIAPNAEIVREHARRAGFPANRITAVRSVIDPTTAENH
jgi:cell division inhibitor SulA